VNENSTRSTGVPWSSTSISIALTRAPPRMMVKKSTCSSPALRIASLASFTSSLVASALMSEVLALSIPLNTVRCL
jgi:hypothetical protein